MISTRGTLVGRAVLRMPNSADPSAARSRLRSLLEDADLQYGELSPSSLLLIRLLRDPLPGLVALDALSPLSARWSRAVTTEVADAARTAARPALESVPAGSNAVLFADRAELLACLASDWLHGRIASRWWWQLVIAGTGGASEIEQAWWSEPRYVPAAMDVLAHRSEAISFAGALRPSAARTIREAVAAAFGVAQGPGRPPRGSGPPTGDVHKEDTQSEKPAVRDESWLDTVPEATNAGLHPEQRLLVCLSLALRRRPGAIWGPLPRRSLGGVAREPPAISPRRLDPRQHEPGLRAVRRPGQPQELPELSEGDARSVNREVPAGMPPGVLRGPRGAGPPMGRDHESLALFDRVTRKAVVEPPRRASPTGEGPEASGRGLQSPQSVAPPPRLVSSTENGGKPAHTADQPSSSDPADPAQEEAPRPDEVIDTTLGGLFYLLNVALSLGLYSDFTMPREPGISLDVWDFLILLGRELLGSPVPVDPGWDLLAGLAGRKGAEPPGRGFHPEREWRAPMQWLSPLQHGGPWAWSAASGRLRLDHPGGFPALDVARTSEPPGIQLDKECRRADLAPGVLVRRPLPRLPTRPLRRWVATLARYVRSRLASALGQPAAVAVELLLRHQARVFVTPVHVDIALSLQALPIEIRLAGLDRDPGWIPAAGRVVAFHFD